MTGSDPRLELDREAQASGEGGDLMVVRAPERLSAPLVILAFAVAAVGLFLVLNAARTNKAEASTLVTATANALPSAPEPLVLPVKPEPLLTTPANPDFKVPPYIAPTPMAAPILSPVLQPSVDPLARRRAPAVVIELGPAPAPQLPAPGVRPSVPEEAMKSPTAPPATPDAPEAAFAARLSSNADVAIARPMSNPGLVVPQGAIIPAVLETAINSDLPGFTRALVSRDVRSFDGKTVLIPRGSRLIGQYKSAMSLGQSRAFVIWTRVTRPDGVSVDIGSPAADELGRGGLAGDVDRHFFQRFGGSILLSVLNGLGAAIANNPSTQISIGSPVQAANAAASAQFGDAIPPTVKVPQGEAIRIFVARDLDFSLVGAMR